MSDVNTLAHDAFTAVKEDTTPIQVRYPKGDYSERPLRYMVKLNGENRWRRVYATPIGNVSVIYLKSRGTTLYCETALEHILLTQQRELDVWVCECCALMIANNDESSCRDYYNHTHPVCDKAITYVDVHSEREVGYFHENCNGCGELIRTYGKLYRAIRQSI